ncbi:MAG: magnesium transporter [Lentisphaeria bacterium]|nr:magnesium transporter [Lentisphaeria bacterium]
MPAEQANSDQLHALLRNARWDAFREAVREIDPADLADIIEDLPSEQRENVFRILDPETASDVVAELDTPYVDAVVGDLHSSEIAELAGHMAPDDAADLIAELDREQSAEVLAAMGPEGRREVTGLLGYGEDTAGGLMTSEVLALPRSATVADAERLTNDRTLSDPVFNIFVIDPADGTLLGCVALPELVAADPHTPLERLMNREVVFATTDEDQQEVARRFRRYDLWVMPVVDAAHRLVGRITVDDVIDVLHEEADEDLARMVGAPDLEEEEESLLGIARLRLPWLLITMVAGLLNSVVISTLMRMTRIESLAVFVPAILAMGGNTGMQSSAICVRGIALDEHKYGRILTIVSREIRVGICLGLVCGSLTGVIVWAILSFVAAGAVSRPPAALGLVVGAAMASAMAFASTFGAVVPILLHRAKVDPAVASGPFITTSNDLSATLIYFLICALLLGLH